MKNLSKVAVLLVAAAVGVKVGSELWIRHEVNRCVDEIAFQLERCGATADRDDDGFGLDDCFGC